MENTVTLTLERYHDLLDKSEELSRLNLGEIKLTTRNENYYSCDIRIEFLKENDFLIELKEISKESNRIYNEELLKSKEHNSSIYRELNNSREELSQIKNHWAYKLFIKKGG